jgi:hypothetical protein
LGLAPPRFRPHGRCRGDAHTFEPHGRRKPQKSVLADARPTLYCPRVRPRRVTEGSGARQHPARLRSGRAARREHRRRARRSARGGPKGGASCGAERQATPFPHGRRPDALGARSGGSALGARGRGGRPPGRPRLSLTFAPSGDGGGGGGPPPPPRWGRWGWRARSVARRALAWPRTVASGRERPPAAAALCADLGVGEMALGEKQRARQGAMPVKSPFSLRVIGRRAGDRLPV